MCGFNNPERSVDVGELARRCLWVTNQRFAGLGVFETTAAKRFSLLKCRHRLFGRAEDAKIGSDNSAKQRSLIIPDLKLGFTPSGNPIKLHDDATIGMRFGQLIHGSGPASGNSGVCGSRTG